MTTDKRNEVNLLRSDAKQSVLRNESQLSWSEHANVLNQREKVEEAKAQN